MPLQQFLKNLHAVTAGLVLFEQRLKQFLFKFLLLLPTPSTNMEHLCRPHFRIMYACPIDFLILKW